MFDPLQTLKQVFLPANVAPSDYPEIRLTLSNPVWATLSGLTSVAFVNPPLTMALAVVGTQQDLATFGNGVPVGLSGPAPSVGVSTDLTIAGGSRVLTNGTLAFGAGESAKRIMGSTVDWGAEDVVRVSLSHPVRATYSGLTNVYYVRTALAPPATNATLIGRGAVWKYLDTHARCEACRDSL